MDNLKQNRKNGLQLIREDIWAKRSPVERRSEADKRVTLISKYFLRGGKERRTVEERRKLEERRDGWMRMGKWRSEAVFDPEEN